MNKIERAIYYFGFPFRLALWLSILFMNPLLGNISDEDKKDAAELKPW